jgi:hypothetical protein
VTNIKVEMLKEEEKLLMMVYCVNRLSCWRKIRELKRVLIGWKLWKWNAK